MTERLEWGRQPPDDVAVAWGARAIYDHAGGAASIDLLWDRQAWRGDSAERASLAEWINTEGLKAIKDACVRTNLTHDSTEVVSWTDGNRTIEASPQGSHGYLYLVAYETCAICLLPHPTKRCATAFERKDPAPAEATRPVIGPAEPPHRAEKRDNPWTIEAWDRFHKERAAGGGGA